MKNYNNFTFAEFLNEIKINPATQVKYNQFKSKSGEYNQIDYMFEFSDKILNMYYYSHILKILINHLMK